MNKNIQQRCTTVMSMLVFIATCAIPLELHAAPSKKTYRSSLREKIRRVRAIAQQRARIIYKNLRGDNDCSPEQVIITRLLFIAALLVLFKSVRSISCRPRCRPRTPRPPSPPPKPKPPAPPRTPEPPSKPHDECNICFEKKTCCRGKLKPYPCPSTHPHRICNGCLKEYYEYRLNKFYETNPGCPLCDKPLETYGQ